MTHDGTLRHRLLVAQRLKREAVDKVPPAKFHPPFGRQKKRYLPLFGLGASGPQALLPCVADQTAFFCLTPPSAHPPTLTHLLPDILGSMRNGVCLKPEGWNILPGRPLFYSISPRCGVSHMAASRSLTPWTSRYPGDPKGQVSHALGCVCARALFFSHSGSAYFDLARHLQGCSYRRDGRGGVSISLQAYGHDDDDCAVLIWAFVAMIDRWLYRQQPHVSFTTGCFG